MNILEPWIELMDRGMPEIEELSYVGEFADFFIVGKQGITLVLAQAIITQYATRWWLEYQNDLDFNGSENGQPLKLARVEVFGDGSAGLYGSFDKWIAGGDTVIDAIMEATKHLSKTAPNWNPEKVYYNPSPKSMWKIFGPIEVEYPKKPGQFVCVKDKVEDTWQNRLRYYDSEQWDQLLVGAEELKDE